MRRNTEGFKKIIRYYKHQHQHIHRIIVSGKGDKIQQQQPPQVLTTNSNKKIFIYFAILLVSEVLPFLEAESNGILHLTSNCLKRAINKED